MKKFLALFIFCLVFAGVNSCVVFADTNVTAVKGQKQGLNQGLKNGPQQGMKDGAK